MGSNTLWYNRKQISRSGCKTSLATRPDHSNPYYWSQISIFIQLKNLEEEEAWLHSSHTQLLDLYDYKHPSREMYLTSCILSTCLFHLRCGHAKTKSTLFQLKMALSPNCDTCGVYEDVHHIIFNCQNYEKKREVLRNCCEKAFNTFTMCSALGHHTSPPWARQLSTNLFGRFIKTTGLVHSL